MDNNEAYWKRRAKHGRDRLFETPEDMFNSAIEYFEWCDENPLYKHEWKGNPIELVATPLGRPYTWGGLTSFLGISENYFRNFHNNNKDAEDFMAIIERIGNIIYTQKFEGASVGLFNSNIIARDLGLTDKSETKTDITSGGKSFNIKDIYAGSEDTEA